MDKIEILTIKPKNGPEIHAFGEVRKDTISARLVISLEGNGKEIFMSDLSEDDAKEIMKNLIILIDGQKECDKREKTELISIELPHKPELKIFGEIADGNIMISIEQDAREEYRAFLEINQTYSILVKLYNLGQEVIKLNCN